MRDMLSGPRKKSSKAMVAILALAACGVRLLGGQTFENPSKPVARNAGRILKLKESVRIEDVGGEYFYRYPRILKMAPDGSLLGVCGDDIFVLEKNADETLRIAGYTVVDDETPNI